MNIRVGINGFGRMGRLSFRASWDSKDFVVTHVNDPGGDAATMAHLLEFDSIHGRWREGCVTGGSKHDNSQHLSIEGREIAFSQSPDIAGVDWTDVDIVLECSGRFRTRQRLLPYLQQGVKKVIVSAPVDVADGLNIVMGVNDDLYDPTAHDIVTAASCTTNCLAPVVETVHDRFSIQHGCMTTIHDMGFSALSCKK